MLGSNKMPATGANSQKKLVEKTQEPLKRLGKASTLELALSLVIKPTSLMVSSPELLIVVAVLVSDV